MNDYAYDVFLSYMHRSPVGPWVSEIFRQLFVDWLSEELNADAEVFFDDMVMKAGDPWPDKLRDGIRGSRVLLAVCSPGYFRSSWCLSEWESFRQREQQLGLGGLRVPIRHNDGEHFPQEVQLIQMIDFSELVSVMPVAFKTHPKALDFEDKVRKLAADVAVAVKKAPPFDPTWPVALAQANGAANTKLQRLG